jgi:polar amino acid transport system substrate-binding protein
MSSPVRASFVATQPNQLVVAMPNWPPLKIVDNGKFGGIEVLIFKEITKQTGIDFTYLECPWVRCLKMIESGEADLISSVAKLPERAEYIEFIGPPLWDGYEIAFYTMGREIESYVDLKKKSIGVIRGGAYFNKFDNDKSLRKFAVTEEDQLIKMLLNNRIDVIVGIGHNLDYLIHERGLDGKIKKSPFTVDATRTFYLGMSKKSNFIRLLPKLSSALLEMKKSNRIHEIEQAFLNDFFKTGMH